MIYVVIQFSCIIYLIFNAQFNLFTLIEYALSFAAVIIGLSALFTMKFDNLNILPNLTKNHELRTTGIYRFIRHPMYSSVLLLSFALLLSNAHIYAQIVMGILLIDLILKSTDNISARASDELKQNWVDNNYEKIKNTVEKIRTKYLTFKNKNL